MNSKYLLLLFSVTSIHAMQNKQITPVSLENDAAACATVLSDAAVCAKTLSHAIHPNLVPHLAKQIRDAGGDIESIGSADMTQLLVQAMNNVIEEKNGEITSRVSKKNTAYIATAVTVITTIITALASSYNSKC